MRTAWNQSKEVRSRRHTGFFITRNSGTTLPSSLVDRGQTAYGRHALQVQYSAAIQAHLDAKAHERQYDGMQTAITYRGHSDPQFGAEGEALFAWRSAVWTYSIGELTKVLAGARSQPSVEAFIAELPAFVWPVNIYPPGAFLCQGRTQVGPRCGLPNTSL